MSLLFEDLKEGLQQAIDFERGKGEARVVRITIKEGKKPTEVQIEEIEAASARPIAFDDAPELTPEQYAEMAEIARKRRL